MFNPENQTASVFKQCVLPFGSIASVTAFLRVPSALWVVGNRLLKLMWSACFDGFLSVNEAISCGHTGLCIASVFSFLGWKRSEDKLVPFSSICKILGVQLDMRDAKLGFVQVSHTLKELRSREADSSSPTPNCSAGPFVAV